MKRQKQLSDDNSAAQQALRIGDVAKATGIGIEALRFYEKSGLLDSPARTVSGYRLYDSEVLSRLDFIKRAQVLGFSLEEIKRIISDKRAGQNPCAEVRQIVKRKLVEVDERLREMKRYRNELAASLSDWEQTGDLAGHVCGLIETSHVEHGTKRQFRKKKR